MELYIGGYAQGKLNYVLKRQQEKKLACTILDCGETDGGIRLAQLLSWQEGQCLPEEKHSIEAGGFTEESIFLLNHLHLWVKEQLSQGTNPTEKILEFCARYPDCILISDEVGNGIVPLEKSERIYREETGRILILLAQKAERVERIICGLGQRLK